MRICVIVYLQTWIHSMWYEVHSTYIAHTYCRDGVLCLVWFLVYSYSTYFGHLHCNVHVHTPPSSRRINGALTSTLHFQKLGPKGGDG